MTSEPPRWSVPEAPGWASPAPPPTRPFPPARPGWGVPEAPRDVRPGVVPLRPLGVGEIIDGAISIIRRHWKIQLGLSAAVVTAVSLLQAGALYLLYRDTSLLEAGDLTSTEEEVSVAANTAQIVTVAIGQLAQMVLLGALAMVAGRAVLGQDVTPGQAWAAVRPHLWRLIALSVLVLLAVTLLVLTPILFAVGLAVGGAPAAAAITAGVLIGLVTVAAAVWLWVRFGLAAPALVLEQTSIPGALRRSYRLVTRNWWRSFGILLLGTVIATILGGIISTPFTVGAFVPEAATDGEAPDVLFYLFTTLGSAVAGTITYPFTAGVVALLYVDLRMRREALDLTLVRAARAGMR